ncbi:MAG TPA: alpha/beta hydrolase family protein [Candidatus Acidoferrales bacterium]|nr:alpha/beta hydrolase family protein [Candidatus Acidoferrales bacterium]
MSNLCRGAAVCFLLLPVVLFQACTTTEKPEPDRPRLTRNVVLKDVTFRSASLGRDMPYRVILPATSPQREPLPVIYLLHGGGGGYRDWTNYSDVARYAESGFLLVMPEGGSSYYTNAVDPPSDRYEDYIVHDLIADVESRFPVASGRANRAIVGMSMGGFGAVTLGLRHTDLFTFVGGLSSALDVPRRAFVFKRFHQSRHFAAIFGPAGSSTRRASDPFVLIRAADPEKAPYFFLTCGEQEGLLPANREFAALLSQRHFRYEFHTLAGSHDWNQWDTWIPALFRSISEHMPPAAIR